MRQKILTRNDCYKAGRHIRPAGVMVHSTGANNPNLSRYVGPNRNNNDWNRPGVGACVHAFIGLEEDGTVNTVQTLPWDMRGWHAGASANNTHISFEICEDGLDDAEYFAAVYQEAVELTAYLCELYGLDPLKDGVVICHSEGYRRGIASNHADVMHWFPKFGKNMDTFREDVNQKMEEKYEGADWSKEARDWATSNGIIAGYGDGEYGWGDPVTREQLAVILYRLQSK